MDKSYRLPFVLVTSLFVLWGIANSLNGSLIRHFQLALDLQRAQAGLVDSAFYLGYFVMALPAGLLMQRKGYKWGILLGLLLYAAGAALFYPAAAMRAYPFFLFALFTIATGLAFLETAANPYITVLGPPEGAARRLNLAQSFNGLSIILGPAIGSLFIFSDKTYTREGLAALSAAESEAIRMAEARSVQGPYLILAGVVLLVALLFYFSRLPEPEQQGRLSLRVGSLRRLLGRRHLRLGILALLGYMGVQASVWGYFVDFKVLVAPDAHIGWINRLYGGGAALTPEKYAGFHASAAMVLFMAGRFAGTWLMNKIEPPRLMAGFCLGGMGLLLLAMFGSGLAAVAALMGVYFFLSILFPTIFALATQDLGELVKLGASFVIMAIVGGAIIPPITGWVSDQFGIQMAMVVPLLCFCMVLYYAVAGHKVIPEPSA